MVNLRQKYNVHKGGAKQRGIEFNLTYEEWYDIWHASGKLYADDARYCMARHGDKGAYEVGNVRITTTNENTREYATGQTMSAESRAKKSKTHRENHAFHQRLKKKLLDEYKKEDTQPRKDPWKD